MEAVVREHCASAATSLRVDMGRLLSGVFLLSIGQKT